MEFKTFLFYCFAGILVFAAAMMISRRNPVHSVMFLILCFFNSAALWIMLGAEFLGISLVLVYVGAVMVLFLFVVMMLDVDVAVMRAGFIKYSPVGLLIGLVMVLELSMMLGAQYFGLDQYPEPAEVVGEIGNTKALGLLLYTDYLYPFEIAAAILLVAMVAAILLTFRRREGNKAIDPRLQVAIRKNRDRIRVLEMPAEEKVD
jgi:NADH-quinone oxidoreductase subunit J